jgi:hypothetical protein
LKSIIAAIAAQPLRSAVTPRRPGRIFLICFILCFLVAAAALVYPVYVIRPFRHQEPRELMIALAVWRYRPFVMILCALTSFAAAAWYWARETRWQRRVWSAAGVLAVSAITLLSRVNVYEIMFHPAGNPSFSTIDQSKLDGDEKVIAVSIGTEARAYPIRIISYHHIINDIVDGVPIVATY